MIGARDGAMTVLQRIVAFAMSRDLRGFVVPGTDVARAAGLDLGATGMRLCASPRHANVLIVIAPLPTGLADAASVAYAQMPRPRAILALGNGDLSPLPDADATGALTQSGLVAAIANLREVFAARSFQSQAPDFDAPALRSRIEYTCPMHPEVVSDEPGNCPKCGMTLVPRETAASPHDGHTLPKKEHKMSTENPAKPIAASHDHSKHAAAETPAQYTCPIHPEVVSDKPGNCPKCGMFLVPVDATDEHEGHGEGHDHGHDHSKHTTADAPAQYTCPMHPEVVSDNPGNCPKCGMFLVPADATDEHEGHGEGHGHGHDHSKHAAVDAPAQYTCPMHPEVVSDKPGSCPKCGMFLVPADAKDEHAGHGEGHGHGHDHSGHGEHGSGEMKDGIEAHFMSMVDLTRDMPASTDGLKMEWIDVPFGPFFPGLPSGLRLDLTLDGDAVASSLAQSAIAERAVLHEDAMQPDTFADDLAAMSPLSPTAYRLLACLALEQAAGQNVTTDIARARAAAVERERLASHLGWLTGFGAQSGFTWLQTRAAALQLKTRDATQAEIAALAPKITALLTRVLHTPLLNARLKGIGHLQSGDAMTGPVARAGGIARDARSDDPVYAGLGFVVRTSSGGDALARLAQRCAEISQSLELISQAGAMTQPEPQNIGTASGTGEAVVETPRGAARLSLTLQDGMVTAADIGTPTVAHVALIGAVADGQELGDALTGIGSLDISPWEMIV
ncbi:MAG: Ni,Fe-hydrogenase III large subunit/DNA-directed RNA polymerase subunit M [Maritalea sp.]|jgi:Ni,Fe-hydrogenase III large subunit/DNA-directed RNA polymerase subunit M/transcription elongation factor TFIIS